MSRPNRNPLDGVELVPPQRETMTEAATATIRHLILTGKLPPGMPLRLNHLAARLGMSVMPIREALRVLEAERLVSFRAHHGATVTELSADDVEEAYALREALEGLAARDGVRRMGEEELEAIRGWYARMAEASRAGDRDELVSCDQEFHRALFRAGGRPDRARRIVELWESTSRAVPLTYRAWDPLDVAIESHRPLMDAIERRDARAAERLSRAHTHQAGLRLLKAMRRRTPAPSS